MGEGGAASKRPARCAGGPKRVRGSSPPPTPRAPLARAAPPHCQVLESLHGAGRARAIGVSNFEESHLRQLLAAARVRPAVNQARRPGRVCAGRGQRARVRASQQLFAGCRHQAGHSVATKLALLPSPNTHMNMQFEVHPRRPGTALRGLCAAEGIVPVAYASLGCGALLSEPAVARIAAEARRTPAQVLLRWGLQQGCAVIPKSVHPGRVAEFAPHALLEGWELSEPQMAALAALEDGHKFCWDPEGIL